jgi:hypothetical protein
MYVTLTAHYDALGQDTKKMLGTLTQTLRYKCHPKSALLKRGGKKKLI